jgi:hypothetical protein
MHPPLPVFYEIEQKLSFVTTMGNVPNLTRYVMPFFPRHGYSSSFCLEKSNIGPVWLPEDINSRSFSMSWHCPKGLRGATVTESSGKQRG